MKKLKLLSAIIGVLIILPLMACGADTPAENVSSSPPDLFGQWRQVNSVSANSYQGAIISGNKIEIYWVSNNGDTRSLYWSGSFIAPDTADEPFSWVSQNDTEKTKGAILASQDDTKVFTYADNQISYSSSIMGTTTTVRLEQDEWAPGLVIEEGVSSGSDISEEPAHAPASEPLYSSFPFSIAGIEFSLPDYYEKNEKRSDDDTTCFSATKGDIVMVFFLENDAEGLTRDEFEQEKTKIGTKEFLASCGFENPENTVTEDIQIAGLDGCSVSGVATFDEIKATIHLEILFNEVAHQVPFIIFVQVGNPQYNYLEDYIQMLASAELAEATTTNDSSTLELSSGIRPEFKEAMDSYEEFFDEYVAFMEKYENSKNSYSLFADYTGYLKKYTETMTELSQINDGSLSMEELTYYVEVQSRITQKLLTIGK